MIPFSRRSILIESLPLSNLKQEERRGESAWKTQEQSVVGIGRTGEGGNTSPSVSCVVLSGEHPSTRSGSSRVMISRAVAQFLEVSAFKVNSFVGFLPAKSSTGSYTFESICNQGKSPAFTESGNSWRCPSVRTSSVSPIRLKF